MCARAYTHVAMKCGEKGSDSEPEHIIRTYSLQFLSQ